MFVGEVVNLRLLKTQREEKRNIDRQTEGDTSACLSKKSCQKKNANYFSKMEVGTM